LATTGPDFPLPSLYTLYPHYTPVVEEESKTMIPASWRQHLVIEIDRGTQMGKHGGQNLIGRAVYDGQYKHMSSTTGAGTGSSCLT
jgi:hypothetical protein